MIKAKSKNKFSFVMLIFFVLIIVILSSFSSISDVFAETVGYSDVLTDLNKDSSFNEQHYPKSDTDYSLKVMQVAESSSSELFVYVYQPSGKAKNLKASSINISITVNDKISYKNYKLILLNSSGVFYKYLVQDFTVLKEPTRYYAISSIYRPFDATIDKDAEHDNTVTEVNYEVSRQYCFSVINDKPYCSVVDIESIVITDKFVGFVRYKNGFQLYVGACDSHFVAFNTDKRIDKLLEADVYYTRQEYSKIFAMGAGESEKFGKKEEKYAYLKHSDKVEHTGDGWFAGTYKWNRIETVEQFIAGNDLTQNVYSGAIIDVNVANKITDAGKAALKGKKWVLRFAETSYSYGAVTGSTYTNTTLVGDVTILRLKFETDGITYNLGVIDNKQTGSDKPSNDEETTVEPKPEFKKFLLIIAIILLIIILMPILPLIIKSAIFIIKLPFKLVGAVFKGVKKSGSKGGKSPPEYSSSNARVKYDSDDKQLARERFKKE